MIGQQLCKKWRCGDEAIIWSQSMARNINLHASQCGVLPCGELALVVEDTISRRSEEE
jgi:hypothetical protein